MNITFLIDGFGPTENATENARWLVELAAKEIGCPPEAIQQLAITDAANFGPAIHRHAPGLPFTNNDDYVAVAKTISLPSANGVTPSAIVLRDFVLGGALTAINKEFSDRTGDEQRFIYVIWHEVGHALDATRRMEPRSYPDSVNSPTGLFKIRHLSSFFAGVVLSEIPACWFAASACNQAMFDLELQYDNDVIVRSYQKLKSDANSYRGDPGILRKIAFDGAQLFWVPFVQYGKAIAHLSGNLSLARSLYLWPDAPDAAERILGEYSTLLKTLLDSYPETPADFEPRLFALWDRLAKACGFTFIEDSRGDAVFWSNLS